MNIAVYLIAFNGIGNYKRVDMYGKHEFYKLNGRW